MITARLARFDGDSAALVLETTRGRGREMAVSLAHVAGRPLRSFGLGTRFRVALHRSGRQLHVSAIRPIAIRPEPKEPRKKRSQRHRHDGRRHMVAFRR